MKNHGMDGYDSPKVSLDIADKISQLYKREHE